jgi:5-methylcytosine-specific restriction endonuclease McrA
MDGRRNRKHRRSAKNAAGWYVIRDPKTRREWRAKLYAEQGERCALCGHTFPLPDEANESIRKLFAPEFDHVVRYRDGGSSDLENLRLVHAACNRSRESGRAVSVPRSLRRRTDLATNMGIK